MNWKKTLKITGISLGALLALLLILPFAFKSKIVSAAQTAANKNLKATVSFNPDLSLSLIRNFPNLSLGIDDLIIVGKDSFANDTLINAPHLNLVVDLASLTAGGLFNLFSGNLDVPSWMGDAAKQLQWGSSDTLALKPNKAGFLIENGQFKLKDSIGVAQSKTIVFIHGLFQNPNGWSEWKTYFEANGYTCYSPAYPFHEGNPSELRENINAQLGRLTLAQVLDSLITFIDSLPEKPILIGHSMGGLCVQKLLYLQKGVVGICISSAAPKGILSLNSKFLRANIPLINPFKGNSVFQPDAQWFQQTFCNTMTLREAQIEFEKSVVPESRNIARTSIKQDGYVDFKKPHNPLLFISGEDDHLIPTSLNKKNMDAYTDKNSKKEIKIFSGRTHYICNQKNWEDVASYINVWLKAL